MNYTLDVGFQVGSNRGKEEVFPCRARLYPFDKTIKEIDWEQRRYEIAKDCFVREFNRISEKIDKVIEDRSDFEAENIVNSTIKRLIKGCVGVADDLIKELKGEE